MLFRSIRRIQLRLGITTVFVTHDQEEALAVSDRIAVMSKGGIEQIGTPEELYLRPATPVVADFVGQSSVVPARVTTTGVEVLGFSLPLLGDAPTTEVDAYIRPENVRLSPTGVPAVVLESTFLGSLRRTRVRTSSGATLLVQHAVTERVEYDQEVRVEIAPEPVAVRPRITA